MQATLSFLADLKKNNNRDWFLANKHSYDNSLREMIAFANELLNDMKVVLLNAL